MNREYHNNLIEMRGPHVLNPMGIGRRMAAVIIALIPTLVVGDKVYGSKTLLITFFCMMLCLLLEIIINALLKRKPLTDDWTCLLTGMLIALNLPSNVPIWVAAAACGIAIIIVKGPVGSNRNVINPACTALCVVYICFGQWLELWPAPLIGSPDIASDATIVPSGLDVLEGAEGALPTNWELFLGFTPGPFGCVSAIAIMLGAVYLIWRRLISSIIPISILVTCGVISVAAHINPLTTVFSGGLMMGACFMATDPVTSPMRHRAMAVYGIAIGIITMAIRLFIPFLTEGIYLAIVLMNLTSRKLDRVFIMEKYKSAGPIKVTKAKKTDEIQQDNPL